ncbi:cytochrome P450 [Nostoc sp. ChiQUE01b]|uniref:cytochrome P450 n=1 Tax=Nostoc sp. ChiQUE01b TaxID=3075376 RepID=UPI002AD4FA23|nr:cytochrome P450 [Nostoc sp. ChiQUE01b]MDZ8261487.1 cytochrome P450 [Nostoc sp. ChiQUE01b]
MTLPPSPKTPTWLLGLQLLTNPLGCMDAIYKRYGDIVTMMDGSTPVIYVSNPSGLKQIFSSTREITVSSIFNQKPTLTQGIAQIDGLVHKHRRSLLIKVYQGKRMETFGQRICELTEKIMSQQAVGKTFIAYETILKITLQIAIEVVIGLREGERFKKIKHLCNSLIKYENSSLFNIIGQLPFAEIDFGKGSLLSYHNYLEEEVLQFLHDEVKQRRKQADSSRTDMLCDLIFACDETGKALSDEEVRDLLFLPILASRDGASHSITWSLYWIHRSPAVRKRLFEELNSLGENPDPMDVVALPYLNAVCNESLRIWPSALFTFRRLVEAPVEIMGYELVPGTVIVCNIYSTHQREDVYPEPKQFKPERFLEKKFSPYEFIPFGGGARNCIAGAFGMFQMKLVLATIISRYELALVNKQPEGQRLVGDQCHAKSGVKMVMHGRYQHQGQ